MSRNYPRRIQDPKTGRFVKIIDGRRHVTAINDSELEFIKMWRKARVLGKKYAIENGKKVIKAIKDELDWDWLSFDNNREFQEELGEFILHCFLLMEGVFRSYEEAKDLEPAEQEAFKDDYLKCYVTEYPEENKILWIKEKRLDV